MRMVTSKTVIGIKKKKTGRKNAKVLAAHLRVL